MKYGFVMLIPVLGTGMFFSGNGHTEVESSTNTGNRSMSVFSNAYENIQVTHHQYSFQFILHKEMMSPFWKDDPKVNFWQQVVRLSPDSGILNISTTREILGIYAVKDWDGKPAEERQAIRDSIRKLKNLPEDVSIYFTPGKKHFYNQDSILPLLQKASEIFASQMVDPFYAQAVLLIESPVANQKSSAGAYGHFQLMKKVAIQMGLTVNRHVDEREDFDKCAVGAARLFRTVCIPETQKILDELCIPYTGQELWFKLLVLHVYHAGAYNVKKAILANMPIDDGNLLIKRLWETKAGAFGNESQNYTQLVLANHFKIIREYGIDALYAQSSEQ